MEVPISGTYASGTQPGGTQNEVEVVPLPLFWSRLSLTIHPRLVDGHIIQNGGDLEVITLQNRLRPNQSAVNL